MNGIRKDSFNTTSKKSTLPQTKTDWNLQWKEEDHQPKNHQEEHPQIGLCKQELRLKDQCLILIWIKQLRRWEAVNEKFKVKKI